MVCGTALVARPFFSAVPTIVSNIGLRFPPSMPDNYKRLCFGSLTIGRDSVACGAGCSTAHKCSISVVANAHVGTSVSSCCSCVTLLHSVCENAA